MRVLVVEDDEDDFFLTSDVLKSIERVRFETTWRQTFSEAFSTIKAEPFDVALIDYRIGSKTGIDFVKAVQAAEIDVPMILLTGLRDEQIDLAASEAGASDYLNKDELTPSVVERSIRFACANAANRRSLAEWGSLLQTTLDNTGSGVAAVDASGNLVAFNQRLGEMLSQLGHQMGPVALQRDLPCESDNALGAYVTEVLRRIERGQQPNGELETADGRVFDLSVNKTSEGGCVIVIRDITEQRQFELGLQAAKEEAEATSRSKTVFLATMSHELRTPLNAIIGFSELILNGVRGQLQPVAYREYIEDILVSGRHLREFIDEILAFSKAEGGQSGIIKEKLDLRSELDFCLRLTMPSAEGKEIELQSNLDDVDCYLCADRTSLRRMLINLLSNAVKFTPVNGTVSVMADQRDDGSLSISVSDTGVGIPEEHLPLVLQPFHQVNATGKRTVEGSGLGLAIVKSLARLHEAKLEIRSTLQQGTTVEINFPQHAVISKNIKKQGRKSPALRTIAL